MSIKDIVIGQRVLVQSGADIREHALIKGILDDKSILVRLSDNRIVEITPKFIIKSFEK